MTRTSMVPPHSSMDTGIEAPIGYIGVTHRHKILLPLCFI